MTGVQTCALPICYATRPEVTELRGKQEALGRSTARCAALIPIKKSAAWWDLAQDERRAIFEERSRHIGIGLDYLPAVARRLHHSRELAEPFDFLTWFEYAPEHGDAFEDLVRRLRATTASAAPCLSAAATKSWPSWVSPLMANKASPAVTVRLSMEIPVTACGSGPAPSAPVAAATVSTVHSDTVMRTFLRQARSALPVDR